MNTLGRIIERFAVFFAEGLFYVIIAACIWLLTIITKEEGFKGLTETIGVDVFGMLKRMTPMILAFFFLAGSLGYWSKQHPDRFKNIMSGREGVVKMLALSSVLPGPAGCQQLKETWEDPACDKASTIMCLVAMMGLSVNAMAFRAKLLGGELTLAWVCMCLFLLFEVWVFFRLRSLGFTAVFSLWRT